jgi:hypothetical protein
LICLGVNYLKTEIKYDYLTDWREVFIEDIMGRYLQNGKQSEQPFTLLQEDVF